MRPPCFGAFLVELNSSSDVEPYSGGIRLHLLLLATVMEIQEISIVSMSMDSILAFDINEISMYTCQYESFVTEPAHSQSCNYNYNVAAFLKPNQNAKTSLHCKRKKKTANIVHI